MYAMRYVNIIMYVSYTYQQRNVVNKTTHVCCTIQAYSYAVLVLLCLLHEQHMVQ